MKSIRGLLAGLLALCLLFPLVIASAAADSQELQLAFPESGGWPPELIGAWVGLYEELWSQFTFYPDGKYDLTVFEAPTKSRSGTSESFEKADSITLEGGMLRLTAGGTASEFRHIPSAYVRLKAAAETAGQSVDWRLVGTYGGRIKEAYVEWTIRGDGRFTQVTPSEASAQEGYCIAGNGEMAILLNGRILQCSYLLKGNAAVLTLPGEENVIFEGKPGPLTTMQTDVSIMGEPVGDFGLILSDVTPAGWIIQRYSGAETEVGIPGGGWVIPVVAIGDEAFKGNKDLLSVTIPIFTVKIGSSAFEGCEKLQSVLLIGTDTDWEGEPGKSPRVELSIFQERGESVLPGSCPLASIGEGAFRGCKSLKNLNLAESAAQSPYARYWWIGHSETAGINLPDGLTSIGANAFEGCESITSVAIPDSVTSIGRDAFKGCGRVTLIVSPDSYPMNYARNNGIPYIFRSK